MTETHEVPGTLAGPADRDTRAGILHAVQEEVDRLVKTVPGPLASISLRMADCSVDVTWHLPVQSPGAPTPPTVPEAEAEPEADTSTDVISPIVGTFYRCPEPGATPFVELGAQVRQGQTVGIVEAMKLMNPVTAPCTGSVVAIEVHDCEPVEFGQVVLRIAGLDR